MTITRRINLLTCLFIILFILLSVFIIYPLFQKIKNSSQELISQKGSLTTLEAKITSLDKFKIIYKDLNDFKKRIDDLFVNSELPVKFILFLEEISQKSQLEMAISPISTGEIGKDPWSSLSFQITLKGSSPNFLRFLDKLENSPYLVEIQDINIKKLVTKEKTSLPEEIEANLSFKVFAK